MNRQPADPKPSRRHHGHAGHRSSRSREESKRRQQRNQRLKNTLAIGLMGVAILIVGTALLAPDLLKRLYSQETSLGNGVMSAQTDNQHLRRDYNGIDVSHHQGLIDWQRVAADTCVQFVYIKATEGSDYVDEHYLRNARGARKAGLHFGAYHYLTSMSSIEEQFANFRSIADQVGPTLIPVIDIEEEGVRGWTRGEIQHNLAQMIRLIEAHYGCSPIIYSYARFYNEMLAPRFNSYKLFLAHYNAKQPIVGGAGAHHIWQHTDQGVVDGIETPVDLDVYAQGTSLQDLLMPQKD